MGARRTAEEALAIHPDSNELREALIHTYIRVNDMRGVIALCESLPADALTPTILEARGVAHLQLGENDAALDALRAAARTRPLALVVDRIGRVLHRLGRIDEAIGLFKSIVDQLPPNEGLRFGALRQLAFALRDARRWTDADVALQNLIALYRQQPIQVASAVVGADMEVPYHGWLVFLNKGTLAHALDDWLHRHPDQQRFWPESFVMPGDEQRLAQFRASAGPAPIFAVKPMNLYGGQGITLTRDPTPDLAQPAVIQRYLDNPYLINGRKFHARVYVMVSGLNPVRAYVYREGIARIAPEYYATDDAALARPGVHVTNTALHLRHPELRIDTDPRRENAGNIWTMGAVYRHMAAEGVDAQAVWARIANLARRFVSIAIDTGLFARQAAEHMRYTFPPRVFGLDVLIDATGQPWLIEYQRNPALGGNPLVNRINGELCRTILAMTAYTLTDKIDGRDPASLDNARLREAVEAESEHAARGLFERIL